jgi:hypothetical protein
MPVLATVRVVVAPAVAVVVYPALTLFPLMFPLLSIEVELFLINFPVVASNLAIALSVAEAGP